MRACVRACVCVSYLDRKCEYELIIDFIISANSYKYLTFHLPFSYTFPFSASCIPNPVWVYMRLGPV